MEMDTLRDGCNFPASVSSIELRFGIGRFCLSLLFSPSTLRHLTCCCTYACTTIQFEFCFHFVLLCFFASSFVFSSASANYRIQLIYLLAILDSSFARGAKQRVSSLNIALMDRRSFDGLCEAGLGSRGLASGHSIECVHLSRHHHYKHLGWFSDL